MHPPGGQQRARAARGCRRARALAAGMAGYWPLGSQPRGPTQLLRPLAPHPPPPSPRSIV
eukprot:SAG31_NODE_2754_length_5137_cov_2.875645_1_plen_59_part_10